MTLLAVALIDLAIFGSLGGLWIGGTVFIVVLHRWILRFERGEGPADSAGETTSSVPSVSVKAEPVRPQPRPVLPQTAAARQALVSNS